MKHSHLSSWRHIILLALLGQHTMQAQTQSPPVATYDSQNSVMRFDWQSNTNRTFFPQVSTDLNLWNYAGALHFGTGAHFGMIQSDASKTFLRLRYSDLPVATEAEAGTADFDLDGLSNLVELENTHTDPLAPDSDHDGLPDGWEVAHSISPLDDGSIDVANGPDGEFGGGGVGGGGFTTFSITTNAAAFGAGVAPIPTATLADLDGDGLANARDAGPTSYAVDWETNGLPAKFVFMPIPGYVNATHGGIVGCNDLGDILAEKAVYSGGAWHALAQIAVDSPNFIGAKIRVDGRNHDAYVKFQPQPTSISDDGEIVGYATVYLEPVTEEGEAYEASSTLMAFAWNSWSSTPHFLAHPPSGVIDGNSWDEYPQIAADGSITVRRRANPTNPSNTAYLFDRYTGFLSSDMTPSYPSALSSVMGNSGFLAYNEGSANTYSWMPGASPVSLMADSLFSTPNPRTSFQTYVEPTYLGEKPGPSGGYCINFWGKAMIRKDGKWRECHEMGDATLLTKRGIAFRARNPTAVQVWKNGDTVQSLNGSVVNKNFTGLRTYLVDSTPDGSVLIQYYGSGQNGYAFLVPIDIDEVISDQISDIQVNKLPSSYFGGVPGTADPNKPCEGGGGTGFPNNPMLMGCRSDGKAYLKTSVYLGNMDAASVPDKLLVGLRTVNRDTRLPLEPETRIAVKPLPSPALTSIDFLPLAAASDLLPFYEMVYGWDVNGDGKLQQAEVAGNFQKTPLIDSLGAPSTDKKQLVDLIHISTPTHVDHCVDALANFTFWQSYGMEYTEDLINAFIQGDKTEVTSNSHVTETTTTISAVEPTELSHPVGLSFDSSGVATTHQFNFDKDSELSEDAYRSVGLETLLANLAIAKQTDIEAAAPAAPGAPTYLLVEIPVESGICFPGDYGDYSLDLPSYELRLFYSLKKAYISGAVLLRIDRYYNDASHTTQRLEVSWDQINATVDDIYDFSYDTPELPRQAVIVQSGFTGLGTKGKVCGIHAVLQTDPDPKRILIINL